VIMRDALLVAWAALISWGAGYFAARQTLTRFRDANYARWIDAVGALVMSALLGWVWYVGK